MKKTKRFYALLLTMIMFINSSVITVSATGQNDINSSAKKDCLMAVHWLENTLDESGAYGDNGTIKDICDVECLFHKIGHESTGGLLDDCTIEMDKYSNDSLARLYLATGNADYLNSISAPNYDGGFGLTAEYASDILDTLLVFEAYGKANIENNVYQDRLSRIFGYFKEAQNEDGGFSYTQSGDSNYLLSLQIALAIQEVEQGNGFYFRKELVNSLEEYLKTKVPSLEEAECFEESAYRLLYLLKNGQIENFAQVLEELEQVQSKDGSFHGSMADTIAAIYLLHEIEEKSKPYITILNAGIELSTYTAYIGYDVPVEIVSLYDYDCNANYEGTWQVELLQNDRVIETINEKITFSHESQNNKMSTKIIVHVEEGDTFEINTKLLVDGKEIRNTEQIRAAKMQIGELIANAEYGDNGCTQISWNDISNDYCKYNYQLFRKCGEGDWESRSLWDGEDKVKVLNIYPNSASANHLKNWLTSNLSQENSPAGKGLFVIDTVSIDNYNRTPDAYLKDANGDYKYDVLYFGAYDSNGHKDLRQESYEATQRFADTGRGILFGHDTVTMASDQNHVYFSKFANQLGIKLGYGGNFIKSTKVKVVNSGLLTSYPWKLEGTLTVPTTHAYQQFTGGNTKATVWMELINGGYMDQETGACSNGYLFSRNHLAMIQTGHSNGQASDDERKILANTLFYLKQLSTETCVEDKASYDLASPKECEVYNVKWNGNLLIADVNTEDEGTAYEYYVNAIPVGIGQEEYVRQSEVVSVDAISGIKNLQVAITPTEEACEEALYQDITLKNGTLLELECAEQEEELYLHVRAVDHASNVGKTVVIKLPEKNDTGCFETGYVLYAEESAAIYGADITLIGKSSCPNNVTVSGSLINISGLENVGEGPDLEKVTASVNYQNRNVTVHPNVQISQSEFHTEANINSKNSIMIYTNSCSLGKDKKVCIYSEDGDITISSAYVEGNGIIYAPNGTVAIHSSDFRFTGTIIAKRILLTGSRMILSSNNMVEEMK